MFSFFSRQFFTIGLIFLVTIFISASFFRFVVLKDYHVTYEVECDPTEKSCFIGCTDDNCAEEYLYYVVDKYAHDVVGECGNSVKDCELAKTCQADNIFCEITYCDQSDTENNCSTEHLNTGVNESVI